MNTNLKYWYLHNHKLFRNLSFLEINALCILKKFKKSKKNEYINLPYSDKKRIYFLKRGTIKLLKIDDSGEEVLIDIIQKGDLFGDISLENSVDHEEYFKVVSQEAVICTFYKDKLEEIMNKKPHFALSYIKFIGFKIKKLKNSYKNILFRDAKTRLLLLLRDLIENENQQGSVSVLPNYLTQNDYAQLICTTRQTVIKLFKELEKERILTYTQKEITINDIKKINELVSNVN